MEERRKNFLSVNLSRFLMKTIGFWTAETEGERRFLNFILTYTIFIISYALWIEAYDFYYSTNDFYAVTYTACSSMCVVIVLLKLSIFVPQRKEMIELIRYSEENIWYASYDEYGTMILEDVNRNAATLMCLFNFFVQGTVFTYMTTPMIENLSRNKSERLLPFRVWLGSIPISESPIYEIVFFTEILTLIHTGICFCCFDNFLCLLNLQAAGQFRILQHKLETLYDRYELKRRVSRGESSEELYEEFKRCVVYHQKLIRYGEKLEGTFTYTTLCQLLISGILLCVAGFQVFLGQDTLIRRMLFIAHVNACFFQLFVVTVTCHELMTQSRAVGEAAYATCWERSSYETNKKLRNDVLAMMTRSTKTCCITAGGFFPVSLDTFVAVLSTAASYFTLLRKFDDEKANS